MKDLSLERFAMRLGAYRAQEASRIWRRAAVAAVLRFASAESPEVLLIRRATRADDRWSGHVAFPGGLEEPGDADLAGTAIRETAEEVGIDLRQNARLLGRIDPVRAIGRGILLPMTITPYAFHLVSTEPEIMLSPEATDFFWLPLEPAAAGALDSTHESRLGPVPMSFPCWRYQGQVIWGLTYRMLRSFIEVVLAER